MTRSALYGSIASRRQGTLFGRRIARALRRRRPPLRVAPVPPVRAAVIYHPLSTHLLISACIPNHNTSFSASYIISAVIYSIGVVVFMGLGYEQDC